MISVAQLPGSTSQPNLPESCRPNSFRGERQRDVSGASQFPLRHSSSVSQADPTSYKAKEIAQTPMLSRPIEAVPADLPYPSLAVAEIPEGDHSPVNAKTSAVPVISLSAPAMAKKGASHKGLFHAFRANSSNRERDLRRQSLDSPSVLDRRSSIDSTKSRSSTNGGDLQLNVPRSTRESMDRSQVHRQPPLQGRPVGPRSMAMNNPPDML
jgi:hypothetical protein